jgi:hypothetical protein
MTLCPALQTFFLNDISALFHLRNFGLGLFAYWIWQWLQMLGTARTTFSVSEA